MPLLLFVAILAGEIAIFLEVGGAIGTWPTVGAIMGTAFVGAALLRRQGFRTLARARARLARNESPVDELADGAALAAGALLLLVPGYFTDALGLMLMLPPVRRSLLRRLARRAAARRAGPQDATVIDGEYRVLNEDDEPRTPASDR